MELRVRPSLVRRALDSPPPLLAVFVLRWWDYWTNARWSDHDVTSDALVRDLFDGPSGVGEALPGEYEAHTAFVRSSEDLGRVSGDEVRCLLRAPSLCAWYFVRPARRLDADAAPGFVCEQQLFNLLQRAERAGVPTGWPSMALGATELHTQNSRECLGHYRKGTPGIGNAYVSAYLSA